MIIKSRVLVISLISFLMLIPILDSNYATTQKSATNGNIVVGSTIFKSEQIEKNSIVLDLGREYNINAVQMMQVINEDYKVISGAKIRLLDKSHLIIENIKTEGDLFIKQGNELSKINISKKENNNKFFLNKERTKFIDNSTLLIEFTKPVDISSVSGKLSLSLKGKNYNGVVEGYFSDGNIGTAYNKIIIHYEGLEPNALYSLNLLGIISSLDGEKLIVTNNQGNTMIVRDSFDYNSPVFLNASPRGYGEVSIQFQDASDLKDLTELQKGQFKLTNFLNSAEIPINDVNVIYNQQTNRKSEIRLKVGELSLDQRYVLEFSNVSDVNGNTTSGKAMVSYFDRDEKGPKLANVETITNNMLRLIFNKEVFIPENYSIENISINNDVKAIKISKDPLINNALILTTSIQDKQTLNRISIEGIIDKYGISSIKQFSTQSYYSIMSDSKNMTLGNVENSNIKGQNALTLYFSEPIGDEIELTPEKIKVAGLEVYYIYKVNDRELRVITSLQKQGVIYTLSVNNLKSIYGSNGNGLSRSFSGFLIE